MSLDTVMAKREESFKAARMEIMPPSERFPERRALRWAQILRKRFSRSFAWPFLLLLLATPSVSELSQVQTWGINGLAILFFVAGAYLRLRSRGYFKENVFVLDGPYRYVRNPMELGIVSIYISAALLFRTEWQFFLLIIFSSIIYLQYVSIAYDRHLFHTMGSYYLRYKKRVRRWWPSRLPGINRSLAKFSLKRALHEERASFLWIASLLVVFALKKHFPHLFNGF